MTLEENLFTLEARLNLVLTYTTLWCYLNLAPCHLVSMSPLQSKFSY